MGAQQHPSHRKDPPAPPAVMPSAGEVGVPLHPHRLGGWGGGKSRHAGSQGTLLRWLCGAGSFPGMYGGHTLGPAPCGGWVGTRHCWLGGPVPIYHQNTDSGMAFSAAGAQGRAKSPPHSPMNPCGWVAKPEPSPALFKGHQPGSASHPPCTPCPRDTSSHPHPPGENSPILPCAQNPSSAGKKSPARSLPRLPTLRLGLWQNTPRSLGNPLVRLLSHWLLRPAPEVCCALLQRRSAPVL